jgi:hypothetical protein
LDAPDAIQKLEKALMSWGKLLFLGLLLGGCLLYPSLFEQVGRELHTKTVSHRLGGVNQFMRFDDCSLEMD